MENENKEKKDCGCGPDCCPPKKNKLWMKIVFGAVILAAIAIISIKLCCPGCGSDNKCSGKTEKSCCADSTKPDKCKDAKTASCCSKDSMKSGKCEASKKSSCCPKDAAK